MSVIIKGKFRKPQWRFLRSYSRMAQEQHDCEACPNPIFPGEQYRGEVWVYETRDYGRSNDLEVRKYHDECPDDGMEEWLEDKHDLDNECHQEETQSDHEQMTA